MLNLSKKNHKERRLLKSQEIVSKCQKKLHNRSKFKIEIVDIEQIEDGVRVFAKAWKGKKQIGFGKDGSVEIERFNIYNPPILVGDDNGDLVSQWTDETTGELKERRFREDAEEALLQSIEHTLGVMKNIHLNSNIEKGKVGNTTSTFYPDAGSGGTTCDGVVFVDFTSTWSTSHDDNGTNATADNTATSFQIRADSGAGNYRLRRAIATFNTASIGAGDTVDSAVISWWASREGSDTGASMGIVQSSPASNGTIVAGDFDAFTVHQDTVSDSKTVQSLSTTAQYYDFTFTPAWVTKAGITRTGVRHSLDYNETVAHASPPGGTPIRFNLFFSDQSGTTQDPKLVVEHTTPVTRRVFNIS